MGLLAGCTGDDTIDVANVERDLKAMTEETSSIPVSANCPDDVRNEAGTRFRCTVVAHGRSYAVGGEVTEGSGDAFPWEFDEDDLHVGPATLTCAQLRQDSAWEDAAAQLLAREAHATQAETQPRQLRAVGALFEQECRGAATGHVPYPVVAARVGNP
jgi:hypothetical protein